MGAGKQRKRKQMPDMHHMQRECRGQQKTGGHHQYLGRDEHELAVKAIRNGANQRREQQQWNRAHAKHGAEHRPRAGEVVHHPAERRRLYPLARRRAERARPQPAESAVVQGGEH